MAWSYLIFAGLLEIGFTTSLRYVDGFTKAGPTAIFVVLAAASLYFLNRAAEAIPLGTAYAVWTGIGAIGTVVVGITWFDEPADAIRLALLVVLVGAIAGLKLVSPH